MNSQTIPTNAFPIGGEDPSDSNIVEEDATSELPVERRLFLSTVRTHTIVSNLFLNNKVRDLLNDIEEKAHIRKYVRKGDRILWAHLENKDGTHPEFLCATQTTLASVMRLIAKTKQQLVAFVMPSGIPCTTALKDKRNKVQIAIVEQHHEIVSPERSPDQAAQHSSSTSDESLRILGEVSITLEESIPRVPVWAGFYDSSNVAFHPAHPFLTFGTLHSLNFTEPERGDPFVIAAVGDLILHKPLQSNHRTELAERIQQTGQAARVGGRRRSLPSKRRSSNPTTSQQASTSVSITRLGSSLSTSRHSRSTRRDCESCTSWSPLVVFNTTSLQHLELPKPDCVTRCGLELESWDYNGVQFGMVTHRDTYKIIMAFESCVVVYEPTVNDWMFYQCLRPTPFGLAEEHAHLTENYGSPWPWVAPSAIVSGRLHCADVIRQSTEEFTLRLFEVDYHEVTWSLRGTFNIRKRHYPQAVRDTIDDIRFFDIVECMGDIYAIIPVRTDEYLTTSFTSEFTKTEVLCQPSAEFYILPVQFHILRLDRYNGDGDDPAHRVLRMVVPQGGNMRLAGEVLLESYEDHHSCGDIPQVMNWLKTAAAGSVIFVSVCMGDDNMQEYTLEYDIATGESRTGMIRENYFCTVPAH